MAVWEDQAFLNLGPNNCNLVRSRWMQSLMQTAAVALGTILHDGKWKWLHLYNIHTQARTHSYMNVAEKRGFRVLPRNTWTETTAGTGSHWRTLSSSRSSNAKHMLHFTLTWRGIRWENWEPIICCCTSGVLASQSTITWTQKSPKTNNVLSCKREMRL